MSNEKLAYTEGEVEQLTGVKVNTLQFWRFHNRGPRIVRLGLCVLYPDEALRQWIENSAGGCEPPLAA
jgi:hypothetical protein